MGKMKEHPNQSQSKTGRRPPESPCILCVYACSVINFAMLNGSRWKESHGFIYLAESPKDASNKDSPASQSSVADSGVFSIQSNSPSKGDGTTSGTSPDSPNARYPDQQAFNSREGHGQCKFSPFRDLRLTFA